MTHFSHRNIIFTSAGDTGCHVTEPDRCHRDKAEIERIKQTPVLPDDKYACPGGVEEDHRRKAAEDHQEVALQTDGICGICILTAR